MSAASERKDYGIYSYFVRLQLLRLRVHAMLAYGEQPLDVAVVALQQAVAAEPLSVNIVDKVAYK